MGKLSSLSDIQFIKLVSDSNSVLHIMRVLGYNSTSGGVQSLIAKRIRNLAISTVHFSWIRNRTGGKSKYKLSDILIPESKYINRDRLKKRLVSEGLLKYECGVCSNTGVWNDKQLSLQLDHKNGIYNDHTLSNIRFLCPNCHSQTETYSGKNRSLTGQ